MAYDAHATDALLACTACGTQFPNTDRSTLPTCRICDDPRQYTPPSGQAFATMGELRARHKNVFHAGGDARLTSIVTEPKLAIGQRAILVRTPRGNVLWDCLTLVDEATVAHIRSLGGLDAIVISHPHYFSSHVEWAAAFQCPVYLRVEDRQWVVQTSPRQVFLGETEGAGPDSGANGTDDGSVFEVLPGSGALAIRLGGHFPGSQVLLFDGHLLIADTLVTTPAGLGSWATDALGTPRTRPAGMNSFAFMWSIPNMIPLSGDEVFAMWQRLKPHDFTSTHGAFVGVDIHDAALKQRVLQSMKIQTQFGGWARQAAWEGE